MNTVSYSTFIGIPREQAWQNLRDLSLPHNYVPGVTRTEITSKQTQGIGTSRLVYLGGLIPMRETVTEWREGKGFTIELALKNSPMPPPMKAGFFSYAIEEAQSGTQITNSLHYGFSWPILDATLGKISIPIIKGILWLITRNMKRFYLQGH